MFSCYHMAFYARDLGLNANGIYQVPMLEGTLPHSSCNATQLAYKYLRLS
jgi:hypothetical protein